MCGGVTILTNDIASIKSSLERLGVTNQKILEIPFIFDVPKGIPYYSAHFKIDVFRYFSTLPKNQYSILCDCDVLLVKPVREDFWNIVNKGKPMIPRMFNGGGLKRLDDCRKISPELDCIEWMGGEFIGGTANFFKILYDEILSIKDSYWKAIPQGLCHIGDEMLTTVALNRLRDKESIYVLDAMMLNILHRYYSVFEHKSYKSYNTPFIHFPGEKVFFRNRDLNSATIDDLFRGWWFHMLVQRLKGCVINLLKFLKLKGVIR